LTLDTSSTPDFLGLRAPGGLWDQLGGVGSAGEGVVIGIVDGGIWPEHPSLSDRVGANSQGRGGRLAYQQLPGWHGRCVPGEEFTAANCNQKLIGARYYNAGWGGNAGIDAQLPWEFNSPRDFGGHGTHVATTAGGNANVPATGPASVFGSVSGIAPRARIASYKVCWETGGGGSCFSSDSVAAIDQAVADGVDVINFSISGSRTNFRDPVEIAFLFAADAGVFVAASAGNSGPTTSTVAHPSPWLTTVAAGTHNRNGVGAVTLGNGVPTPVPPSPPPSARSAHRRRGRRPARRRPYRGRALLQPGGDAVLDPVAVAGKIVVCDRGVTARVNKSLAVQQAGGVGMILVNTRPAR
jgi:subtilisin family serine protease